MNTLNRNEDQWLHQSKDDYLRKLERRLMKIGGLRSSLDPSDNSFNHSECANVLRKINEADIDFNIKNRSSLELSVPERSKEDAVEFSDSVSLIGDTVCDSTGDLKFRRATNQYQIECSNSSSSDDDDDDDESQEEAPEVNDYAHRKEGSKFCENCVIH